ncbi:unnamed protein product [Rhizoctonia solani]|uniref:Uncharacterized protein n=1 Tax=Rhizoctonia solani TaxID=456999 RepID=A0A8H3H7W4_9AGAM|nr:unnamed protein product [Rhizoctonia solani]
MAATARDVVRRTITAAREETAANRDTIALGLPAVKSDVAQMGKHAQAAPTLGRTRRMHRYHPLPRMTWTWFERWNNTLPPLYSRLAFVFYDLCKHATVLDAKIL